MKTCLPLLIFYSLASYRLALLLSDDVGPFGMFSKLRSFLKREAKTNKPVRSSKVHLGIACQRCTSIWIALPVAAYAFFHRHLWDWFAATGDVFLGGMALSAAAILFHRAFPQR